MGEEASGTGNRLGARIIAVLLGLIGLYMAVGGGWLLSLGGSPYYVVTGILCLASAWLYWRGRDVPAMLVYLLVFVGTCLWAYAEVGADCWQLMPRIVGPAVFAAIVVIHWLFARGSSKALAWGATVLAVVVFALFVGSLTRLPGTSGGMAAASPLPAGMVDDWTAFGRTPSGSRYSPDAQITPANVGALQVAWKLETGEGPGKSFAHTFEVTPLKVGDLVYICTPKDTVIAVDADTGAEKWRFDAKVQAKSLKMSVCRGLTHYQAPAPDAAGQCKSRLIYGTIDARLIALDALTGKPCAGFGTNGSVALRDGMGVDPDGFYIVTSPPTIVQGVAVVGGFVLDGVETNEPSGVIRGYDAASGKLLWSWDSGAKDENRIPGPGEHYTRGSPNSWTVSSGDEALGLVYVPMGNATPDYVAMHRTPEDGRYSSAVVALDAKTGKLRWKFQTVHNDIWDYDVGSQPVLFDLPMPGGGSVPALAQPTKQGDIYILDRRTGKPLTPVAERKAPTGTIPEEHYAPTQPASVGFPSPLDPRPLREADMWGATPLDQLWCRIRFRSADYRGRFTPPATHLTIQYPSDFGVMDWGSATIDEGRKLLLINSSHLPMTNQLIPRVEADKIKQDGGGHLLYSPQKGTPYGANAVMMLSPLGIPCNAPPWGKLTAIDLATRQIKWQVPFGTTADSAPLGIAVRGAPNIAGSVVTAGGVLFIGAAIDDYLRAYDVATGKELWRGRLPAGGQAAPMTYVSKTGRQYVVIAAGGHQMLKTKMGEYLIAYALPR